VATDVTDEAAVKQAFASVEAPDHVHVSAASFVGGSVLDTDMASLRAALDARLWGAVHVVRAAAPRMQGPGGSFVFTGGVSSDRPAKGAWPTAVGTAAAEQLARCLALELAPLRFNAIAPGWTDTPMWDGLLGNAKAETFAAVAGRTPNGRLVHADEAAQAVLLLMANRALNAEVLHVDGGLRLA
jgi:NAD(P)-dependent dehydrogenase (short-subunit alcohol dehydrogenase family)